MALLPKNAAACWNNPGCSQGIATTSCTHALEMSALLLEIQPAMK